MKNYVIEFIGTFFLVLVIALTGNPLAIGATLMVMVYMGGHISGAHYNPAVTLGVLIRKKIDAKNAMIYIIFQLVGAASAAVFYYLLKGESFAPAPNADFHILKPLLIEAAFTFALVMVVLNVATAKATEGNSFYGLAIGFTIMAAAYAGGPISGGVYNPAVGVGPILVDIATGGNSASHLWLYLAGPILGGSVAAVLFNMINSDD